jgi:hypothetical protein
VLCDPQAVGTSDAPPSGKFVPIGSEQKEEASSITCSINENMDFPGFDLTDVKLTSPSETACCNACTVSDE